ncbi:hypothetical protein [Streptomyces sp. NPDC003247]|uniref:hypothetical protein n=1 Tax=Streptomyces sp. NPDC003247 TaxID=3364677 RepID=UPI0036AD6DE7
MAGRDTTAPAGASRARLNVAYGSWELIWSHVHRVLVVNLGMAAANLPLLAALQMSHQPWRHPVVFGPLLLLTLPSLAAAFACLDQAGEDGQASLLAFARSCARLFLPALRVGGPLLLTAVAAVADVVALRGTEAGLALIPMAVVIAVLATLSGVVALTEVAAHGRVGRRIFLLAPLAVVRHRLVSAMNLVLIAVGLLLVNQAPLLGLAVVPGCVLFVVWRNCRSMALLTDPT